MVRLVIAVACAVVTLFFAVAVAPGASGGPEATPGQVSHGPHETLPCTGPKEPVNFESFSAGPTPVGLPLTATVRRCDSDGSAHEWPANYVSYIYGDCEIPEGATGCQPPLEIQTWPACQRSMADYSFEGRPLPHRKLPKHGGAEVVELQIPLENRIEVYTKSATIVIFALDPDLARKAVRLLKPQEKGKPPVTNVQGLGGEPSEGLEPPAQGSMEGLLACQS
jgi:hypothetical protein